MAITPPTDVVLGVALAADPEKYRLAAERLRELSAARTAPRTGAFSELAAAQTARVRPPAPIVVGAPTAGQAKGPGDAFSQLEAYVLQSFIQAMLPANAEHVFGKGAAGDIWKSMMAEKLADQLARSGQIGLAQQLATGRTRAPMVPPASLTNVLGHVQTPDLPPASGLDMPPTPPSSEIEWS